MSNKGRLKADDDDDDDGAVMSMPKRANIRVDHHLLDCLVPRRLSLRLSLYPFSAEANTAWATAISMVQ